MCLGNWEMSMLPSPERSVFVMLQRRATIWSLSQSAATRPGKKGQVLNIHGSSLLWCGFLLISSEASWETWLLWPVSFPVFTVHFHRPNVTLNARTMVVSKRALDLEEEPAFWWERCTCEQRNYDIVASVSSLIQFVAFGSWRFACSMVFLRFIHAVAQLLALRSFVLPNSVHGMDMLQFICTFLTWWTALNICIQDFMFTYVFISLGIAGAYGSSMLNFFRKTFL